MIIFLDVDGVLANFVAGACAAHERSESETLAGWPRGTYDIVDVWGMTQEEFWSPIDAAGEDFWAELPLLPHAHDLVDGLSRLGRVVLLTSPSKHPGSHSGKCMWIQKHFGREHREYLIGPAKSSCAHRDAVLVDDYDRNVDDFVKHGGWGILFPRIWNRRHAIHDRAAAVAISEVKASHARI